MCIYLLYFYIFYLLCILELIASIEDFTREETSKYHDELSSQAFNAYQNMSESDVDQLIKKWTKAFTEVIIFFFELFILFYNQ